MTGFACGTNVTPSRIGRLLMAGSTLLASCSKAGIAKTVVAANGNLLGLLRIHPIGQ